MYLWHRIQIRVCIEKGAVVVCPPPPSQWSKLHQNDATTSDLKECQFGQSDRPLVLKHIETSWNILKPQGIRSIISIFLHLHLFDCFFASSVNYVRGMLPWLTSELVGQLGRIKGSRSWAQANQIVKPGKKKKTFFEKAKMIKERQRSK